MLQALSADPPTSPSLILDQDKKGTLHSWPVTCQQSQASVQTDTKPQSLLAFMTSYLHFIMLQGIPMIVPRPKG